MLHEAEGRLNYFLTLALADANIRRQMALKYVSQMWDQSPYWHLWFNDIQGVYKLSMINAVPFRITGWEANCLIHYYPHPAEPSFQSLSAVERMLRISKVFAVRPSKPGDSCPCCGGGERNESCFSDLAQEIGVPSRRFATHIAKDLFWAGGLTIQFVHDHEVTFSLTTQTEWQVRATASFTVADLFGRPFYIVNPGDLDRKFPGVLICEPLFRRLTDGWSELFGTVEADFAAKEEVGITFESDGDTLEPQQTANVRKVCLSVRLQGRPAAHTG